MIKTQSQNEEIRQFRDKVAGEVCDKAGNEFRWKVLREVSHMVWCEVKVKVKSKVWDEVMYEVRDKVWDD